MTTLHRISAALALVAASVRLLSATTAHPMNSPTVTVRLLGTAGGVTEPLRVPQVVKSEAAWFAQLTPEQYRITRTHGTERAFCGVFHDNHKTGVYTCVGCGLPLFRSDAKFDSGTGWPSFFQPFAKENIGETRDTSLGMMRPFRQPDRKTVDYHFAALGFSRKNAALPNIGRYRKSRFGLNLVTQCGKQDLNLHPVARTRPST